MFEISCQNVVVIVYSIFHVHPIVLYVLVCWNAVYRETINNSLREELFPLESMSLECLYYY